MLKTYYAPGMLDWHLVIRVGNASVRFHFKDGYLGPVSVTSAKYSTDDPVLQKIIEDSPQFRRGKITLYPPASPPSPRSRPRP